MQSQLFNSDKKEDKLDIDFTFNTIKSVKKVSWKEEAPWYREILDGFCWLAYCHNEKMSDEMYVRSEMRARYGPNGVNKMSLQDYVNQYEHEMDFSQNRCPAFDQLVVINRGFNVFSLKKDISNGVLRCPCCRTSKNLEVRNSGFVNCEWNMRGILRSNKESKIHAEGRTYDKKLYTFKECNYTEVWYQLDVLAKKLDPASV